MVNRLKNTLLLRLRSLLTAAPEFARSLPQHVRVAGGNLLRLRPSTIMGLTSIFRANRPGAPESKGLRLGRFRISTQLYVSIGGAVMLTLAASLVAWFSFNSVDDAQTRVNQSSVPQLLAASGVAQYGQTLVDAGPSLTAATTMQDFTVVSQNIDDAYQAFEDEIAILESGASDPERVDRIRGYADTLSSNIREITTVTAATFDLRIRRESLQTELLDVRTELTAILVPAIDDQLFYALTGYSAIEEPRAQQLEYFSVDQMVRYRRLAEMQADLNLSTELLASSFAVSEASFVEPLRESFEAAASRIERNLITLEGTPLHEEAAPHFDQLFALGLGQDNVYDHFTQELMITARQEELLASNRALSVDLVNDVNDLANGVKADADAATLASRNAITTGRTLLLVISAVSIGGAVLIIWLFIGRVLLRRLGLLSASMHRMAEGDLEARVEVGGQDEVAVMAAALEVFRRHALEVQRLNLVEQLAGELQSKNDELESVLGDLRRAQGQIVLREKLAALGELTAGVAHEIRNPLNFMNNFSAASVELVEELHEIMDGKGVTMDDDQKSLVMEITEDLNGNLDRIRSHGDRANRIVHDMLMMGRDSGVWEETDVNALVNQHYRLAYHSARAADPDFNLTIEENYDPEAGTLEIIPQDLGRVFLNMVTNACHATDIKRRGPGKDQPDREGYVPTVWLATERTGDRMLVTIRDNGTGMPPDVADKIFNPFFTTKPADQGTGLGLAISNDIIRRHGGTVRVHSTDGEGTEMTVDLPLERPTDIEEPDEAVPAQTADA